MKNPTQAELKSNLADTQQLLDMARGTIERQLNEFNQLKEQQELLRKNCLHLQESWQEADRLKKNTRDTLRAAKEKARQLNANAGPAEACICLLFAIDDAIERNT